MTGLCFLGHVLPSGVAHEFRPALYSRATRARLERIRELDLPELMRFRLAIVDGNGDCWWWTTQRECSPVLVEPDRVVFSFQTVVLARALEVAEWRLVDDGGYLVRARRDQANYPAGFRLDASYWLAFDGSDRKG